MNLAEQMDAVVRRSLAGRGEMTHGGPLSFGDLLVDAPDVYYAVEQALYYWMTLPERTEQGRILGEFAWKSSTRIEIRKAPPDRPLKWRVTYFLGRNGVPFSSWGLEERFTRKETEPTDG